MASCLVTGGAGFIGSHLAEALVARGDKVRVLDNFSTGLLSNLDPVRHEIEILFGDLHNPDLMRQAVQGAELVFHCAIPSWSAYETPELAARWAFPSETLQALIAARQAGVRRFIYASSCNIYGYSDAPTQNEEDWLLPETSYGFAKLSGELQCIGFTSLYGLETVRLRYSEAFGPRQCPTGPYAQALPVIVKSMLAGQPPVLDESAGALRDFIHIKDVVHATLLAAEGARVSGQVYNVARGRSVTLRQVVQTLNQILGTRLEPIARASGAEDGPARTINISRIESDLGFCPSIDLRQGLASLVEFYTRQNALGEAVAGAPAGAPGQGKPHFRDVAAAAASGGADDSGPPQTV
jgi:UDP-glucose 4-epimerase